MIGKLISLAAAVLLIFTFAACGGKAADANTEDSGGIAGENGEIDPADVVMGRVTAVDGDTITMDVIKMPAGPGGEEGGNGSLPRPDASSAPEGPGGGQTSPGAEGDNSAPSEAPSTGGGDSMKPAQRPDGRMPQEGAPAGGQLQNGGDLSGFETSGETMTVTADADTVITVQTSDGEKAGTISDIAVGDRLAVTMSGEKAVSITVMSMDFGAGPGGPGSGSGGNRQEPIDNAAPQ